MAPHVYCTWPPRWEQFLRDKAREGKGATEIARLLGTTPSAVDGKARRLGITLAGRKTKK